MGARLAVWQVHSAAGFCDPAFAANRDEPVHRWTGWVAGGIRGTPDAGEQVT